MKRILIRAGKEPWQPISVEATLEGNVLGTNSGNALFSTAVFSALSVENTQLEADYFQVERSRWPRDSVAEISSRYDHIVIPMANAFRDSFVVHLDRWSEVLERTNLPTTVVGIGGQFGLGSAPSDVGSEVVRASKRFVKAALSGSASVGVRGEATYDFLRAMGFADGEIDIVGCPSLYRPDIDVSITKPNESVGEHSRVAMNVTPSMSGATEINRRMGNLVAYNAKLYPSLLYVPQENRDLRHLLWNEGFGAAHSAGMPLSADHEFYRSGRARFFVDAHTWIDYLKSFRFAFGNRIHGNIAAILAGVPAMVLPFDSRLQELSDYHKIPNIPLAELSPKTNVEELYECADYDKFNVTQLNNRSSYISFLEKNGLSHGFSESGEAFLEKFQGVAFPKAVSPVRPDEGLNELYQRLRWLRGEVEGKKSPRELRQLLPAWSAKAKLNKREEDAGWAGSKLQSEVRQLRAQVEALTNVVEGKN